MFKNLLGSGKKASLLEDAVAETCRMIIQDGRMFEAAFNALFKGQTPELNVIDRDEDIDLGERLVRRLVFQHMMMNPEQDLPASMALISVDHDVERIGDYNKSLLYLARWRTDAFDRNSDVISCAALYDQIAPMFEQTLEAFRDSNAELAKKVMVQSRAIKEKTQKLQEHLFETGGCGSDAIVCSSAVQYLRRISAHLSNIASSIANPFDLLGQDVAT